MKKIKKKTKKNIENVAKKKQNLKSKTALIFAG